MQMAIAIDLLTMCPLRARNLASLKFNDTIHWTRPGRKGRLLVSIQSDSMKNRQPFTYEIHQDIVPRIVRYLDTYRPLLFDDLGDWLFPGRNGKAKQAGNLGKQIKATIRKHTGLTVNIHLMRHVTAKFYLDRHPASYGVVQRVLNHRTIDTTTQHYTGYESPAAVRHFDETILKLRDDLPPSKPEKRRRASK